MKLCFALLWIYFSFSVTVFAQQSSEWSGLVLDSTTPKQTIAKLGKPKKEKIENTPNSNNSANRPTNFLKFFYENIDGWKKVGLSFLDDKLISFEYWPKNKTLLASELPQRYDADFVLTEGFAKGVSLATFEGQKETTIPKVYPAVYFMVAVKPDRYIVATINNNSWKTLWRDGLKKPTVEPFPGYIEDIKIMSRALEKK